MQSLFWIELTLCLISKGFLVSIFWNIYKNQRERLADAEKEVESLNFNITEIQENFTSRSIIKNHVLVKLNELEKIDSDAETK